MECPYCGSQLLTICQCCEQLWCPMCDRHITDLHNCPSCAQVGLVQIEEKHWRCVYCSLDTEE